MKRKHEEEAEKSESIGNSDKTSKKERDGNWLSHIYIPIELSKRMNAMIQQCLAEFLSVNEFDIDQKAIEMEESLHISLSQPFNLRHHEILAFSDHVRRSCEVLPSKMSICYINQYRMFLNQSKTKASIALKLLDSSKSLEAMVRQVDESVKAFGFPVYYQPPIFHISVFSFSIDNEALRETLTAATEWKGFELDFNQDSPQAGIVISKDHVTDTDSFALEKEGDDSEEYIIEVPRRTVTSQSSAIHSLLSAYEEPFRGLSLTVREIVVIAGNQFHTVWRPSQ